MPKSQERNTPISASVPITMPKGPVIASTMPCRRVSSEPLEHGCHTGHMALGFWVRGDAAVAGDRIASGTVSGERQRRIAELLEHHQ